MQNNRAHLRFQVDREGKILTLDGSCNYNCTIQDISEGGARVTTHIFRELPTKIFLFDKKSGKLFECEVRWQRDWAVGVRLVDTPARSHRRILLDLCLSTDANQRKSVAEAN
jgi:hypothetical protein